MDAKFVKEYAAKKKLTKYEQNVLLKMEEKASAKNKNICDYSKEEILDCLREYHSYSIKNMKKYTSLMRKYIDYCIENLTTKGKDSLINYCREITKSDLMYCVQYTIQIHRNINLSMILKVADRMKNPADQFAILGAYEGLTLTDVLELRAIDFKYDERMIYHPRVRRWFRHSDTLVQYGIKALQEYHYDAGDRSIELVDVDEKGPSVIKQSYYVNQAPDTHTINSRILRKAPLIDIRFVSITPKIINKFGLYDAINYYMVQNPSEDFFQNNNLEYRMLLERFSRELSRPSVIKNEFESVREERGNDFEKADLEAYKHWDELLRDGSFEDRDF